MDCDNKTNFNSNIFANARKRIKKTQKDLAEDMGTSRAVVSRIENSNKTAKTSPSIKTLEKYAKAVNCELEVRLIPIVPDKTDDKKTQLEYYYWEIFIFEPKDKALSNIILYAWILPTAGQCQDHLETVKLKNGQVGKLYKISLCRTIDETTSMWGEISRSGRLLKNITTWPNNAGKIISDIFCCDWKERPRTWYPGNIIKNEDLFNPPTKDTGIWSKSLFALKKQHIFNEDYFQILNQHSRNQINTQKVKNPTFKT